MSRSSSGLAPGPSIVATSDDSPAATSLESVLVSIALVSILASVLLFGGMLGLLELGRRAGSRKLEDSSDGNMPKALDAALFALLGLLLAFTFSGAAGRFDARRQLVVEEVNAIGTAWLRLDLLPPEARAELRGLFRRYVDARIETYRKIPDFELEKEEFRESSAIQQRIWQRAVAACRELKDPATTSLVIEALNPMFDITTTRLAASRMHPPKIVYGLLFGLALCCALVAGHTMARGARPPWLHMIAFAGMMSFSVFVIVDVEYPRAGVIRIDAFDSLLVDLRAGMQ